MIDWRDKYNSFNSDKVLIWREWLEGCAKRDFLPPVTICVDPSGQCSYMRCIWCNSANYNNRIRDILPEEHLLKIADFAASWGVKSVHVFGGGEPLENPYVGSFLQRLKHNGIEAGLITNGIFLKNEIADIVLDTCRWIGISLDAGTNEVYMKVKGIQDKTLFENVLENIEDLCAKKTVLKSNCSICVKYLLHPDNSKDILKAVQLAKAMGADDFQIRPAGWENVLNDGIECFNFESSLEDIQNQMVLAQQLESEKFHVYGVWHKFSINMNKKRNYSKCWASPITLLLGADGNCYTCGDRRGEQHSILCRHFPDIEEVRRVWNSEKHKNLLESINLDKCPRCVLGPYHEIVEKVFIKDQMCRNFP